MGRLLDRFSAGFIRLLEVIMVLMMIGMLLLVGVNVFLRIAANSGIDYAEEIRVTMALMDEYQDRDAILEAVARDLSGGSDDEAEQHMQQHRQVWDDQMVSYLGAG